MAGYGVLRWVRALTLASVLLVSGLTGHGAAGGAAPPSALILPLFLIATVAVAPFLEGPVSTRRVAALLLGGQGVLHVILQVVAGTAVSSQAGTSMPAAPGAGMTHVMAGGAAVLPYPVTVVTGAHLGMLLAHVGAAIAVGMWLAAGERALWALVEVAALPVVEAWRAVRDAARMLGATPLAVVRRTSGLRWDSRRLGVRPAVWCVGCVSRRGPPRLSAA